MPAAQYPKRSVSGFAWAAVIIGAGTGSIICSQFGIRPGIWLPLAESFLLLCLAALVACLPRTRKLAGFILAIAALDLAWRVAAPWVASLAVVLSCSQHLSWGGQFFLSRLIRVIGVPILLLTLIGSGLGSRDLFLRWGDWQAPVQSQRFFPIKRGLSWGYFTAIVALIFAFLLSLFLFLALHPQVARLPLFFSALPWAVATAGLNAANEEFQFRSVLLARLHNVIPPAQAIALVAVFFGLSHYFGQPSGWPGVIMTGIAAWIWAKSMIETRGFMSAFLIHFVQDFVIFAFLSMSNVSFPKG